MFKGGIIPLTQALHRLLGDSWNSLIPNVDALVCQLPLDDGDNSLLAWLDLHPCQLVVLLKLSLQLYGTSLGRAKCCKVVHVCLNRQHPQARSYALSLMITSIVMVKTSGEMMQPAMTPTSRCCYSVVYSAASMWFGECPYFSRLVAFTQKVKSNHYDLPPC